jgi:hypothetical protein
VQPSIPSTHTADPDAAHFGAARILVEVTKAFDTSYAVTTRR